MPSFPLMSVQGCCQAGSCGLRTKTGQTDRSGVPSVHGSGRGSGPYRGRLARFCDRRPEKGVELITKIRENARRQRDGGPRRRATDARRSASEPVPVMSIPLSINPSMSARMISARLSTLPFLPRISVARRSRWTICRSKRTTDTLDHVSWCTGGLPRPAFGLPRALGASALCFLNARRRRNYTVRLLVEQTQQ